MGGIWLDGTRKSFRNSKILMAGSSDFGFAGEAGMSKRGFGFLQAVTALPLVALFVLPAAAQGITGDPVQAARNEVQAELAASLPANLPAGPIAILPPKIGDAKLVDPSVAGSWGMAMAETLHRVRPQLAQTDREHLQDLLREQKFGDSAYADPATATKVGKLAAARLLLLTRLTEFRLDGGRIRISLEASVVNVETGENPWARTVNKGIFPPWAKAAIAIVLVLLVAIAVRAWLKHRREVLVHEEIPRAKAEARIDVDGLARSAADARERLQRAGMKEQAASLQKTWVDLDAVLDRVRHALPGGSVDGSRVRDLAGARREAERMASLISDIRRECDRMEATPGDADGLARKVASSASDLRALLDAYRQHLP